MPPTKKLQVFVSSTYTDLREERQAAVEAILTAGHIPAGMELFTAGDESQMDVIRRWIDESDVFLLILGGRYGSLEPTTGKSYIHLEYEYATERGKPLFAVVLRDAVLDERVKRMGQAAIETENSAQLREFRKLVLSKISAFWNDDRDIQLAIHKKLSELARRTDLVGWIPGDQGVNSNLLAEELARLTKENAELQKKVSDSAAPGVLYAGLTFEELSALLRSEIVDLKVFDGAQAAMVQEATDEFGDVVPSLLHFLWMLRDRFAPHTTMRRGVPFFKCLEALGRFGLMRFELVNPAQEIWSYQLTDDGRKFLLRLRQQRISASTGTE